MSIEEKIEYVVNQSSKIINISPMQQSMLQKLLSKILNENPCDFIINKLSNEMTNKTTVLFPGGGLNQMNNDIEKLAFYAQIKIGNLTDNFLDVGTNVVLIDPEYSRKEIGSDLKDLDKYDQLNRAVRYIKSYIEDSNIISSEFIFANESGIVYEVCVKSESCSTSKFYFVGSNFYFSNGIYRVLFGYPNILLDDPEKLDDITIYNQYISELKLLYNNKLVTFKKLIDDSKYFFIFNCIRFKMDGNERQLYSIHTKLKEFLIESVLTEKVNYLLLKYGASGNDYNYYYIYPELIAHKLAEKTLEEIQGDDGISDKIVYEKIYDEVVDPKKYFIIKRQHLVNLEPNITEYYREVTNKYYKKGSNKYYKKYIKYKLKYLNLKNK